MEITTFTEVRSIAREKWREYKDAEKVGNNPLYTDLKKLYHQIKCGKKIIDIAAIIKGGGIHDAYHPKLAIAKATTKKVYCLYYQNGTVAFLNDDRRWNQALVEDVEIVNCLPEIPKDFLPNQWEKKIRLIAPVPLIPPKYLPKKLTEDYYILWEVDQWKMVPPTDPYLLKRITKNHFIVLEGWDLTELEKSVMAGHMGDKK